MMGSPDIPSLTRDLYAAVSGAPDGGELAAFRRLFRPGARLVRLNAPEREDSPFGRVHMMSVDEYVADISRKLTGRTFDEREVRRDERIEGDVASIASVYAARLGEGATKQEWAGTNFIHAVRENAGWRIVSIVWDARTAASMHPEPGDRGAA